MIAISERVLQHKPQLEALSRAQGVERLELFGSAATGEFKEGSSDLDFLVEFKATGWEGFADRYFGLMEGLEQLFGCPVDLVVDSAISNPYFREVVDRNKILLYAD